MGIGGSYVSMLQLVFNGDICCRVFVKASFPWCAFWGKISYSYKKYNLLTYINGMTIIAYD